VVTNYLADRAEGESFADWVHRAEEGLLKGDKVLEGAGGATGGGS
jgi:sulfite reductase (ferredoxin)